MSQNEIKPIETTIDSNESQHRLEAIKNLIFGENIVQINSDFDNIKILIEQRKQELETYIEEINQELSRTIDELSTNINIRITDLEDNLNNKIENLDQNKLDRNLLGKLLVAMGEKVMKD